MNQLAILDIIDANHKVIRQHQSLFDTTMEKLKAEKNIFSKKSRTLWLRVNYHLEISKRLIAENEVLLKLLKKFEV